LPAGWFHQTHDLVCFAGTYSDIHRAKDAWALKVPGRRHREIGHNWYQEFGKVWDLSNPFPEALNQEVLDLGRSEGPDAAERLQVDLAHDYLDRAWDDLAKEEKKCWERRFVWLLYRPDILESWAGVDVLRGRILRRIDDRDVWEDAPEIIEQYKRLKREVSRHHKWRLREVLARWG
jgi:hypothetical protein